MVYPKKLTAILMLYKNMKAMVCSPDGTRFFDIVAIDILSLFPFIIRLDYILRTSVDLMKENGITLKKARS